jgi:hypothetical protein
MAHRSGKMTMEIYAHLLADARKQMAATMGAIFHR